MKGKRHNIDSINIMKIKHGGENNPFFGKKHSASYIKSRIENNPNSKEVNYFGTIFRNKKECLKVNNITRYKFDNLIKQGIISFVEGL